MIKFIFKQFVKNNDFRLIFYVMVGLFISENGFATHYWIRDYVRVTWTDGGDFIAISTTVHYYSYVEKTGHGYLQKCIFEAAVDSRNYFQLMEIQTPPPDHSNITVINFKDKLDKASLTFTQNVITPGVGSVWPDRLRSNIKVQVPDSRYLAVVGIGWKLNSEFSGVSYIRITGKWNVRGHYPRSFDRVVYKFNKPNQKALKSNNADVTTKESENDPVNILKNSEAIVIKGADPGANIKVYSNSGVQIKSVISDNDVVKIKLPSKQIYIVHVGASRYKVAL